MPLRISHTNTCKITVLVLTTLSTIFILSMDGKVLAQSNNTVATQPGYLLTVNVPSHPFGKSTIGIFITTEDGYSDVAYIPTAGNPSWTFDIPPNQGNSVQVCVNSGALTEENCHIYKTNGSNMSVSIPALSGTSSNSSGGSGSSSHSNNKSNNSNDNNKSHHNSDTNTNNNRIHHGNTSHTNFKDNNSRGNNGHHTNADGTGAANSNDNGNGTGDLNGIGSVGSDTHQGNSNHRFGSGNSGSVGSNTPMIQFIGPIP